MIALDPSSNTLDEVMGAFDEYRGAGYQLGITALDILLCQVLLRHQPDAALEVIEQGLLTASNNSERIFEAELYRLKARTLLIRNAPQARAEALSLFDLALSTARNQRARSLEIRVARDLATLYLDRGRRDEAVDLLMPIYATFTEGLDTPDLKEAKALLDRRQ